MFSESDRTGLYGSLSLDAVVDLVERSPVKRAVYWGKNARWHTMPELVNNTGYDRDKEQFLAVPGDVKTGDNATIFETVNQQVDQGKRGFIEVKTEQVKEGELSEIEVKILEIIAASEKGFVSIEAIRKSRRWEEAPSTERIREAVDALIFIEKIEEVEEGQYGIL